MPLMPDQHLPFSKPEQDFTLWRYMDLSKYLNMLSTETLWFSRFDQLGDKFEGSTTNANLIQMSEMFRASGIPLQEAKSMTNNMRLAGIQTRPNIYINSWYGGEDESAAMWSMYGTNQGIAVRTRYSLLSAALTDIQSVYFGHMQYINYSRDAIPYGNIFTPFYRKRKSFMHERESRLIFMRNPDLIDVAENGVTKQIWNEYTPLGIPIQVDVKLLVESVLIYPESPQWILETVSNMTSRLGFNFTILKSNMDVDPIF
jgi:hypothetical protein